MAENNRTVKSRTPRSAAFKELFSLMGSVTSKLLGENTYAKSSIYAERIKRGAHSSLKFPLESGLSLADFKMTKPAQLGYLVAVKDLMVIDFNQFSFMVAWASGEETPEVVNRATGDAYAAYLAESSDEKRFTAGYQTAVIHFVQAIAGEGGVVPTILDRLAGLSFQQASQMVNDWFKRLTRYLKNTPVDRRLDQTTDDQVVKGLLDESEGGFLGHYQYGKQSLFQFNGDLAPDFSEQHHLPPMMVGALSDRLTDAVDHFINQKLIGLMDLLMTTVIQKVAINSLASDNYDLIGLPPLLTTDVEEIKWYVERRESSLLAELGLQSTIVATVKTLPILDLSQVAHTRHAANQNFQQIFAFALGKLHQPLVNDLDEKIEINYGVFDHLFDRLLRKLLWPVLVNYLFARNQTLRAIGQRRPPERPIQAELGSMTPGTLTGLANQLAVNQITHFAKLIHQGAVDYAQLTQAGSMSAFNHLMSSRSQCQALDPNYQSRGKQTKRVLYWLYQRSFSAELPENDRVRLF
ncbi:hypothetical protein ACFQ22_08520 [Lentilactobacillus raoultii]|uniref:Uncharacterized protein n=1 Tax=Lentilactobacillus raoultii TaxID=1987503 RepID=A0ABW3PLV8_9LACO|nr:hypothetical protein [Lentilactobacillus raoultii]